MILTDKQAHCPTWQRKTIADQISDATIVASGSGATAGIVVGMLNWVYFAFTGSHESATVALVSFGFAGVWFLGVCVLGIAAIVVAATLRK